MLAPAATRHLIAATIYVMACTSFVVASALAPFNHFPTYVTSANSGTDNAAGQLLSTTPRPATTTPGYEHYCKGKADNYSAAEPGTKCRRYFRCHSSQRNGHKSPSIYLCPGKLVFNGQKCVQQSEYQCQNGTITIHTAHQSAEPKTVEMLEGPKDCEGRPDGYYQDGESGCRSYFYCSSGMKAVYVCPSRMVYDGQRCVESDTYRCPFTSSDCRSTGSGYFSDLKSACRSYYFCSEGHKLITLTCSDGKVFDGRKCVDSSLFRCPSEDAKVPASDYYAYSTLNRNPSASFVYSPPQTYIITNKVSGGGDSTTTLRAPSSDECEKSYGFFVIPGTGCKQYYYCIAGSRTDLTCSGDAVFNGQICVQPTQYYCPEESHQAPSKSFECRGKADGVYPDLQSGCRNYFLCHEEQPSEFTCRHGQLFDGRKCSDSRTVVCAESELEARASGNVCYGRSNGLYSDSTWPGCRGFVYCRSGRQLGPPGQCGLSERFSAVHSRCLPKHDVFCPDDDEPFVDNSDVVTIFSESAEATTLAE